MIWRRSYMENIIHMENTESSTVAQVLGCLRPVRFELQNEKALQAQIEVVLQTAGLPFQREARLNESNIIDFLIGNIGLEIKIKGANRSVYQQCLSYCGFEAVGQLVLATNRQIMLPDRLHGKPTHILNLGLAWL